MVGHTALASGALATAFFATGAAVCATATKRSGRGQPRKSLQCGLAAGWHAPSERERAWEVWRPAIREAFTGRLGSAQDEDASMLKSVAAVSAI